MMEREQIVQLAEIRVFDRTFEQAAQAVVDLAAKSLDQCDGAGMQLLDPEGSRFFSDPRSSQLDAMQAALDAGPCVECLRTGKPRELEPVTAEERWPSFAPSARRAGLTACLALPLVARGVHIGALNLYAWPLVGFAGWDRPRCSAFAHGASTVLVSARTYADMQDRILELQAALAGSDDIVQQAYGVLMTRGSTTLDEARARLSELARAERRSLEEAARSVLESIDAV